MQGSTYLTHNFQSAHGVSLKASASLPQRTNPQLPLKSTFSKGVYQCSRSLYSTSPTPPTSSSPIQDEATKIQQLTTTSYGQAQYTFEDRPRDAPGTAAYYKSWAFCQKVNAGTTQVPGQESEASKDIDDSANEDYDQKLKQRNKVRSLTAVFSRTNVRRRCTSGCRGRIGEC